MKKIFEISFITFITSVIISIASAYCTVLGVGNIFTSAAITSMFIAGVIEFGRVVLVYDLHHFWHQMPWKKKIPGLAMLIIAMSLSALGVFGFFSNAYSAKTNEVIPIELEVKQLESGIPLIQSEIELNNKQIADIQKTMNSESMDNAIEKYIEKEYITKALNVKKDMQKQITGLMNDNKSLNQKIIDIKKQVTSLQQEAEAKAPTIAHLKYLAKLLHTSNDSAIIIFIVMIMMVFDTLAMYLMITSDWIKIITNKEEKLDTKSEQKKNIKKIKEQPKIEEVPIIKEIIEEHNEIQELPQEDKNKKNNIEKKVSKLVELLKRDKKLADSPSFINSLKLTPFITERLEKELGSDDKLMIKIKNNLKR